MLTHNLNIETEVIFGWMGLLACVSSVLLYKSKQDFPSQTKKFKLGFLVFTWQVICGGYNDIS